MAVLFDRDGNPVRIDKMVERAAGKAHKKNKTRLDKRAKAGDDPITLMPKRALLKRAIDPRSSLPSRERALDELRRRGVRSIA